MRSPWPTAARVAPLILVAALLSCVDQPVAPEVEESPPSAMQAQRTRPQTVPGQYIITFRRDVPIPTNVVAQLADRHGVAVRHRFENVFAGVSAVVPAAALPALERHPLIESIRPIGLFYIDAPVSDPELVAVPEVGLRLRLVADQLTLPDSARVAEWPNQGGSEASAVQAVAGKRPVFHAAGATGRFAGHAHVGFNEVDADEYLRVDSVTPHGSATLVAVFSQDDKLSHNYGLMAVYGSQSNRGSFLTMYTGTGYPLGYWDPSVGLHPASFSPTAGAEHIAVWRIDGSNTLDFQVDGVSRGSVPIASDMHGVFSKYLVGMPEPSTAHRFTGQVAELVLYDRALLDCERDRIVAELGTRYGVDVNGLNAPGCEPPTAPTGLTATTVNASTLDLAWTDASGNVDGFLLERRLGSTGTFQEIAELGAGYTAYSDEGLSAGIQLCYRVASFNANGASSYTPVQCATTSPPPPPIDVPSQGLRLRLVANQLTLPDGAGVEVWPNLSGSEGNATQAHPSKRPSFHAAGATGKFAGRAHVGFNESDVDEVLEVAGVARHGSGTLVAVFSQTDKAAHNYGLMAIYENSSNRGTFATMYNSSGKPLGYWDSSIGLHYSTFSPIASGEHVAVWRIDGGNVLDFQVDGVPRGSVAITSAMHHTFDRYLVGAAEPSGANPFDGQLAELILYDRPLNNCERDQVVGDFGAEYGIDVNGVGGVCHPPAAPTGLTATTLDHQSTELIWSDASTDEDGFRVERRLGSTGTFQEIAELGAGSTAYTDPGLVAQSEYCYRVAAFNANGTSGYSSVQCATTSPPPPPVEVPSQGLRLRLVANQLALPDGTGMHVWPNLGGSEGDAVQTDPARRPSFHAAGVTGKFAGRAHVGFNEDDVDEFLDVAGVTPHGSSTLVAVFSQTDKAAHNYGLLGIYENASNRGTFATMFTGAGDPLGYWDPSVGQKKSTFAPTAGGEHVAVWRINGSNTLDFQVDGLPYGSFAITSDMHGVFSRYLVGVPEPSTTHPFDGQLAELILYDRPLSNCERDQVVGDLGAEYGIDVSGVGGGCSPPATPTGLTATTLDHQAIDLTWSDASTDEDGFNVERRLGPTGTFQLIAELGVGSTAYTDPALTAETEYCYRVAAFNADGTSGYSTVQCATTAAPPPPPSAIGVPSEGLRLRLVASQLSLADGSNVDVWPNLGGSEGDAV